ncbi:MAG: hypothetical protein E6Q97_31590 [Desulfurellales bacterium]|nr:MAG: hypothetical protein E6Q97_31590 [Desulfurellales bacterium]
MSSSYIIGIAGFKRCGKDTLARAIANTAQARGMATAIIAFADPLRQAAAAAYGINAAEFTDDALKDRVVEAWGITRRQMLINLGEAMRGIDPDHWVKAWRRAVYERSRIERTVLASLAGSYSAVARNPTLVIAPDLRFTREAVAIHSLNGLNVLLRRDGVTWDGHINEVLAETAQHRNDALAAQLGCHYAASNPMSIATTSRHIFDCDVDNPVSRRQVEPATEQQRRQLDSMAAAILDRAMQGKH